MNGNASTYARILSQAFSLPDEWAQKLGTRIDESGVSFTLKGGEKDQLKSFMEKTLNRLGNLNANVNAIGEYVNNLTDVDFLYELSLLGKQVAELTTMQRLVRSKSLIDAAMDILPSSAHIGDPLAGDGHIMEQYTDIVQPLQGNILPAKILGGATKLSLLGQLAGVLGLKKWAGAISPSGDAKEGLTIARQAESGPNGALVAYLAQLGLTPDQLKRVKEIIAGAAAGSSQTENASGVVGDIYGDIAGELVRQGDVPGLVAHLRSVADAPEPDSADDYPGQGDIIDGHLDQIFASGTEDGQQLDAEMGSIFRRSAKKQQKKAARIARRQARRQAKQESRDMDARTANEARLAQSRYVRDSASRISPFTTQPYPAAPAPVPYSLPVPPSGVNQWPSQGAYLPTPREAVISDPYPMYSSEDEGFDPNVGYSPYPADVEGVHYPDDVFGYGADSFDPTVPY